MSVVRILLAALVSLGASATTAPTATTVATAPTEGPWVQVSPASVAAGADVAISGRVPVEGDLACPAGDPVVLTSTAELFPPDGVGSQIVRDGLGDFVTSYQVPDSTPAGSYTIGLRCGGGNVGVSAVLTVTGSGSDSSTASRAWIVAAIVVAVAAAGTVWFVVLKKRR